MEEAEAHEDTSQLAGPETESKEEAAAVDPSELVAAFINEHKLADLFNANAPNTADTSAGESKSDNSHEIDGEKSLSENFIPELMNCTIKRWDSVGISELWGKEMKNVVKCATSKKHNSKSTIIYQWNAKKRLWAEADDSACFFKHEFRKILLDHLKQMEQSITNRANSRANRATRAKQRAAVSANQNQKRDERARRRASGIPVVAEYCTDREAKQDNHMSQDDSDSASDEEVDSKNTEEEYYNFLNAHFEKLIGTKPDFKCMELDKCDCMNEAAHELPISGGRVIDLRTCKIRQRQPSDLWSFELDVDFNMNEDGCRDKLTYILGLCNNDPDYLLLMLRLFGLCLLREPARHFFIFLGESRRGKSTLLDFVSRIMTPHMVCKIQESDRGIFTGSNNSLYEADVFASRMAWSDDDASGRKLRDDLKQKTSGSREAIRRRYEQKEQEKIWRTSLIYCANSMPKMAEDQAMRNRLRVIPFVGPRREISQAFMDELHSGESKNALFTLMCWGAMNMLQSAPNFLEENLPQIVADATEDYYQQAIGMGVPTRRINPATIVDGQPDKYALADQWYQECCEYNDGHLETIQKVFESYTSWLNNRPRLLNSSRNAEFATFMQQKNHSKIRPTVGDFRNLKCYQHLKLNDTH